MRSRVTPSTGRCAMISPSASPLAVAVPRRTSVRYSLSESSRKRENLVASPRQSGSTPVASGSRLPVCPTLRAPNSRFTRCTASLELKPAGLSSTTTP